MKKFIIAAAAVLMAASPALAETTVKSMPQYDQKEIQKKLNEAVKTEFDSMDADHDGKISKEEFVEYQIKEVKAKSEKSFKALDSNNDGNVSEEEYSAALQNMMQQLAEKLKNMQPKE